VSDKFDNEIRNLLRSINDSLAYILWMLIFIFLVVGPCKSECRDSTVHKVQIVQQQ